MGKPVGATIINIIKLITVEPYLFFILFGYTVRFVSFQDLLKDRACHHSSSDRSDCEKTGINLFMAYMLLSSLPSVVIAIFLGPWSDKYSRKYPLIISVTGMLLDNVVSAVLTIYPDTSPLWYVAVALLSGVSGGFIICVSAACSYISDISDERSRAVRFSVLEFFNILALIIGNLLGGKIFHDYGYLPVMCLAPLGFTFALLYVIFVVKETKPPVPEDRRKEMFQDLFRVENVKQSYITCSKKRAGNIRLQIWLLFWIGASQKFIDMGTLSAGFPFAAKMYGWGVTEFSNASVVFYAVNALVTVGVIPWLSNELRLHEAAIGFVGILSMMSKMILTSIAYTGPYFYLAWISGTLANASGIAVRSRLSKLVSKQELGRAFSLLGTCESVTPLVGTVVFLQIFNASSDFFPGMPFAVGAIFLIPSALMFAWMMQMPTISLAEYAREEEMKKARPLEAISSSDYSKLEEEEERY